jgi:predicted membrane channel-forming protein YqfA (hemolysin III family)
MMAQLPCHREEFVNALTHGLGVLASIAGGALIITLAAPGGDGDEMAATAQEDERGGR